MNFSLYDITKVLGFTLNVWEWLDR